MRPQANVPNFIAAKEGYQAALNTFLAWLVRTFYGANDNLRNTAVMHMAALVGS